jgi:primosomal protein N''
MKSDCRLVVHTDFIPIEVRIAIIQHKLDRVREHRTMLIQAHTIRVAECTMYLENLISQIEILRREVGAPQFNKDDSRDSRDSRESFWRNLFKFFF